MSVCVYVCMCNNVQKNTTKTKMISVTGYYNITGVVCG